MAPRIRKRPVVHSATELESSVRLEEPDDQRSHRLDMGRPARASASTVQVQIRLTREERAELARIAAERDQTLSAVVRYLIRRYRVGGISNAPATVGERHANPNSWLRAQSGRASRHDP